MLIQEHTFEDQEIVMDFHNFQHCTFNRCKIKFCGHGSVISNNNRFNECSFVWSGAAAQVIEMMKALRAGGFADLVDQAIEHIRSTK